MNKYGLQLYSVRDAAKVNMREALSEVAALGYTYVEFAGFYDNKIEDVKTWLDEFGLIAIGTHTGIDLIRPENIDETVKNHKLLGCKHLTVPSAKWLTEEQMNENIDVLNAAAPILRENGISLGYHNHSGEFYTTPYGKTVIDELRARTEINLEIDTFWLYNAGIDPLPYLEQLKDRISLIHLKDGRADRTVEHNFSNPHEGAVGLAVGEGEVPCAEIVDWARANGVCVVVESEGLEPTGLLEVGRCIKNLKKMEN